jgi:hypothetical protein
MWIPSYVRILLIVSCFLPFINASSHKNIITPGQISIKVIELRCFGQSYLTGLNKTIAQLNESMIFCSNGKTNIYNVNTVSKDLDCTQINANNCDVSSFTDENIDMYDHRIYTIPKELSANCTIGKGEIMGNDVWIRYDYVDEAVNWLHEIGHNWGLGHSYKNGCEYCDESSVMGYCCDRRCPAAPQQWLIGWDSQGVRLNTPWGVWQNYTLSGLPYNFLYSDNIFVGYKWNEFEQIDTSVAGKVLIHELSNTYDTNLIRALQVGDELSLPNMAIKFIKSSLRNGSIVSVCLKRGYKDCTNDTNMNIKNVSNGNTMTTPFILFTLLIIVTLQFLQ